MKKQLFEELVESIKEGGRILMGAAKPKRSFKSDEPVAGQIQKRLGLFAINRKVSRGRFTTEAG